ncbi:MAG: cytochrome c3 family protein [Armatimonadota bacterium]
MTRSFWKGLCIAALALCASLAMAGDYHTGTTLICADCHTMHYSVSHDYDGTALDPAMGETLAPGGPHTYLLKNTPNELCLQCHDGKTFAPDVVETNTNSYVRQAGAINKMGGGAGYETWKGHTLGSMDAPPGNGGAYTPSAHGLECINCHMQHGGATAYRNLTIRGPLGAAATVTYASVTNDTTKDVFQRNGAGSALADHYSFANVDFNEPDTTASKYATWCKNCHTDFHGAKGGAELGGDPVTNHDWLRHPTNDVNVGEQNTHGHSRISAFNPAGKANWAKLMDPAGQWNYATATDAAPGGYTPSCFSCHKAHGNQNAFGLIHMGNTGTVTEEGTAGAAVKSLCKQCHVQG